MRKSNNANRPPEVKFYLKKHLLKSDVLITEYSKKVVNEEHIFMLENFQSGVGDWDAMIENILHLLFLEMKAEKKTIDDPDQIDDLEILFLFLKDIHPSKRRDSPVILSS